MSSADAYCTTEWDTQRKTTFQCYWVSSPNHGLVPWKKLFLQNSILKKTSPARNWFKISPKVKNTVRWNETSKMQYLILRDRCYLLNNSKRLLVEEDDYHSSTKFTVYTNQWISKMRLQKSYAGWDQ